MYLIISPTSTTIFGWWKNRKNWRFLCWAHWSSHLTKAIAALNPEQSFTVTTIYLSRNPSLMVKSLLLMVKLPRIHNKNHQRFYIPTKNYPTIPQWRSSMWISPVVVDFHWDNQPLIDPAPPPRSRSVCRTARPLGQAHSPAQALDKMFDITASSGRWGRYFF